MSCTSSNNSSCCPLPQLLVDEFCQVYNTGATTANLWFDFNPQNLNVTINADADASASTNVILTNAAGTTSTYTLLPGESRTDMLSGFTGISVVSPSTSITSGKACITVYRKLYP